MFADEPSEVQIARMESLAGFLPRLAAGASVRRFTLVRAQFPTTGTPEAAIRLLGAFKEENFTSLVEAIKQRGDFVGQFGYKFHLRCLF